jgi:hypothetical protein
MHINSLDVNNRGAEINSQLTKIKKYKNKALLAVVSFACVSTPAQNSNI